MTHHIDPYEHFAAGDSIVWPFQIEEGGSAKPLPSATVEYYVLDDEGDADADAVADHDDAGVTVSVEPSSPSHPDAPDDTTGYVEVDIDAGVVDHGRETLWQRLRVTDDGGGQRTYGGEWPVAQV